MGNACSPPRRNRSYFFEKYFQGQGIDIGCQHSKVLPDVIGYDIVNYEEVDVVGDAEFMAEFADEAFDWVYSSHCLEDIQNAEQALRNWWRILKHGGYLIIVVPHRDYYERKKELPSIGNPGHKHFFLPFISEPPVTRSLYDLLHTTLPDGHIIFINEVVDGTPVHWDDFEGYVSPWPPEISIEAVIQKGWYTAIFDLKRPRT